MKKILAALSILSLGVASLSGCNIGKVKNESAKLADKSVVGY